MTSKENSKRHGLLSSIAADYTPYSKMASLLRTVPTNTGRSIFVRFMTMREKQI